MLFNEKKMDLSIFDESTETGKVDKFDAVCKMLRRWFFYENVQPNIQISFISKGLASRNPYINCIRNTVNINSLLQQQKIGWNPEKCSEACLTEMVQVTKNALVEFSEEAIKFKKQRTTSAMMFPLLTGDLKAAKYNSACEIVFWHLLALNYDDSDDCDLAKAKDLGLRIGFTEVMLHDWQRAVDYVMDGNIFDLDCKLKFDSEEANIFFLHLYERPDLWNFDC
ncbi:hypothetical protein [Selenomonas sp. KH1T6]|uniref:hypothetical protein n=1 Tax=Selenomonas sp. KH1T6 TaxID=3158784 RepID=UPI0008A7BE33|nr:hypothetical protein SAMN05216583_103167 [Selenomonas ruminantium]